MALCGKTNRHCENSYNIGLDRTATVEIIRAEMFSFYFNCITSVLTKLPSIKFLLDVVFNLFSDQSITYTTNTSAKLSTTFMNCDASHAIDGEVLHEPTTNDTILCQSCAIATHSGTPWLQLDLGNKHLVNMLRVYGRGTK